MPRQDFPESVKRAALKRADGRCEGCGDPLQKGRYHCDHIDADGLTGLPILENAQILCLQCHKEKTAKDKGHIAKAKRREAVQLNVKADKPSIPQPKKPERTITKPPLQRRPLYIDN